MTCTDANLGMPAVIPLSEDITFSGAVLFDELMILVSGDLMHWLLVGSLAFLCALFVVFLFAPALALHVKLRRAIAAIDVQASDPSGFEREVTIRDRRLHDLLQQYLRTLHTPQAGIDPASGIARRSAARATLPAESYFNNQTVFESRLHTEFFKHLPGLLTGIGIIGTFFGLIFGLGKAQSAPGGLNENMHVLVASVKEAFVISAWAICAAMIVTFLEKWLVAGLSAKVNRLCRSINRLHPLSSGEEYLEKLVSASEFSASNAGALKDALVEQLGAILERLAARQIDAAAQQQERLQQKLVAAIDSGLRAPLGSIAQGLGQFRSDQGEQITRSLQDSMTAFADKLDQMLGGQIGQAKDLQVQTLQALEQAVVAFKALAQQVGSAGENATSAMAARLTAALEEMASRQTQMVDGIQNLLIAMRTEATRSQSDTAQATAALIEQLGTQVRTISQHLMAQSDATQTRQQGQLAEFSARTSQLSEELIAGVREQTAAIDKATAAMQGAVADLNAAVSRNVEQVSLSATRMDVWRQTTSA